MTGAWHDGASASASRRQPLDLTSLEVEHVHDRAGDPKQGPQAPDHRLSDFDGWPRGDDGPINLVKDAETLGVLGEGFLTLLHFRDVDRRGQRRASTGIVQGMRDDIHVYHATILQPMPPAALISSNPLDRPLRAALHGFLELRHVLRWSDVAEAHAEKLFTRIAIVRDRRVVDL